MWDAFRAPIDEAFNRKTVEREKVDTAVNEHDRHVLAASKALAAANAAGDVQKIRTAMMQLEAVIRGEPYVAPVVKLAAKPAATSHVNTAEDTTPEAAAEAAQLEFSESAEMAPAPADTPPAEAAVAPPASGGNLIAPEGSADMAAVADLPADAAKEEDAAPAAPVAAPRKPVIAMRGDDRPGMKKAEPMATGRGGRPGERRDGPPGRGAPSGPGGRPSGPGGGDRGARPTGAGGPGARGDDRGGRFDDRAPRFEDRGPRLGEAAFRAQREALEYAQVSLRKLAAQAHGEALTHLLGAWEQRDAAQLPGVQELGRVVSPAVRSRWSQAVTAAPTGNASEALLRLEMAAELPTPAEHLNARRALQLKLLTQRGDPTPAQTWGQDTAQVLASAHDGANARRLQNALKALLRGAA